jgi:hypothetical protein
MGDMSEMTDSRSTMDVRASLAIAGGAAMWGLFWIPLRYVADAGLGPMWAAALTLVRRPSFCVHGHAAVCP